MQSLVPEIGMADYLDISIMSAVIFVDSILLGQKDLSVLQPCPVLSSEEDRTGH